MGACHTRIWQSRGFRSQSNAVDASSRISARVNFKFFNVWIEHESFLDLVETVRKKEKGKDSMNMVWNKLKALQNVLKQLNNSEFEFISKQIEDARTELAEVQNQLGN